MQSAPEYTSASPHSSTKLRSESSDSLLYHHSTDLQSRNAISTCLAQPISIPIHSVSFHPMNPRREPKPLKHCTSSILHLKPVDTKFQTSNVKRQTPKTKRKRQNVEHETQNIQTHQPTVPSRLDPDSAEPRQAHEP